MNTIFVTNMQQAAQVISNSDVTLRQAINKWIADRNLDDDAESFLASNAVSNVTSGGDELSDLDEVLPNGTTLSVYTKAVATGGVKGATC